MIKMVFLEEYKPRGCLVDKAILEHFQPEQIGLFLPESIYKRLVYYFGNIDDVLTAKDEHLTYVGRYIKSIVRQHKKILVLDKNIQEYGLIMGQSIHMDVKKSFPVF